MGLRLQRWLDAGKWEWLEERLGQDLFSRISILKADLYAYPHRTEALAFLTRE